MTGTTSVGTIDATAGCSVLKAVGIGAAVGTGARLGAGVGVGTTGPVVGIRVGSGMPDPTSCWHELDTRAASSRSGKVNERVRAMIHVFFRECGASIPGAIHLLLKRCPRCPAHDEDLPASGRFSHDR